MPVAELSFEKALEELESIVQRLEQGKVDLEESIDIYERGEALKSHCERLLKEAEGRVEQDQARRRRQAGRRPSRSTTRRRSDALACFAATALPPRPRHPM